jgi:hypothetical protein
MGRIGKRRGLGRSKRKRYSDDPFIDQMLHEQFTASRKKFGREPQDGDPVFFDPNADNPVPIPDQEIDDAFMFLLKDAPPQIVYAYKKTGRVLLDDLRHQYQPEAIAEFDAAIAEYFELEKAGKLSNN